MFSQADLRAHVVRPAHSMYGAEQAGARTSRGNRSFPV